MTTAPAMSDPVKARPAPAAVVAAPVVTRLLPYISYLLLTCCYEVDRPRRCSHPYRGSPESRARQSRPLNFVIQPCDPLSMSCNAFVWSMSQVGRVLLVSCDPRARRLEH